MAPHQSSPSRWRGLRHRAASSSNSPILARIADSVWVWAGVMGLTAFFQFYRGAPVDGAIFTVMGLALCADRVGWMRWLSFSAPRPPRAVLVGAAIVLGGVLVFTPPTSFWSHAVLAVIGVAVFVLVWPRGSAQPHSDRFDGRPSPALARTGIAWGVLIVVLALWEVVNFFWGLPSPAADFLHPTISSLLEPLVLDVVGRILFVAVWAVSGLALLFMWRRH